MTHHLRHIGEKDYTLEALGIQKTPVALFEATCRLASRLETLLEDVDLAGVRDKLDREEGVTDTHWANLLFELKRHFILTALLRRVPVRCDAIDKMRALVLEGAPPGELKETFAGPPHPPDVPAYARQRAFFDVVYICLFEVTPFSHRLWGPFLKEPADIHMVQRCREQPGRLAKEAFSLRCSTDPDLKPLPPAVTFAVAGAEAAVRAHAKAVGTQPKAFREHFHPDPATMWRDSALTLAVLLFWSLLPYLEPLPPLKLRSQAEIMNEIFGDPNYGTFTGL